MRIARFGPVDNERPCLVDATGARFDASSLVNEWDGAALGRLSTFNDVDCSTLPLVPADARWASPIQRPGKIICIGLNYADHAEESGMPIPEEPIVFMKAPDTVIGPYDDVMIPRGSEKTDWEVELALGDWPAGALSR